MPDSSPRFVSRLTRNTMALILAGGRGSRLKHLTKWRSKPAVPFGGKFRIVDFPLSNCINSGIRRIGVLTQYKAHSLILHIQKGWGFLRGEFGEFVELWPAQQRIAETAWQVNERTENIGARRLHTLMEALLDDVSFEASDKSGKSVVIDAAYVNEHVGELVENEDLARYIL